MDYEKLHKDTITKLQEMVNSGKITAETARGICADFIPESEDERMRKGLIAIITDFESLYLQENYSLSREETLAWLEKQGEQTSMLDNALKKAFDKSRKDYSLEEKKEASDYSESIIPTSITCGESEEEYMLHKIIEAAYITGKNSMQNSAWSEEYEIALGDALWCCKQAASIAKDENDMGNVWCSERWLKSLKDRIQPNQEWSEEDSMFIKILHTMIAAYVKDDEERKKLVRWLDIHCNAYPIPNKLYPSWKPSDEQMADLWNMVCECRPADQQLLQDIYYGLKTLRGE